MYGLLLLAHSKLIKTQSGPNKGLDLSRNANKEDLPKARPLDQSSWMEDPVQRRRQKAQMRNRDIDESIAPYAAKLDTLGLVQSESTQVIEIKEIHFREPCLDEATLCVELEKDGCRAVRWLDFGNFNTIRKADDALEVFTPSFSARKNVIKVCSVEYAEGSLDITKLYVKLDVSGELEICLDYKDFERISGARKALAKFGGKSVTSPFM